jgi:hypothetical protein
MCGDPCVKNAVTEARLMMEQCFPAASSGVSVEEVRDLVTTAFNDNSKIAGVEEAVAWAEGFVIPEEVVHRDEAILASFGGDVVAMARSRQLEPAPERLSHGRISRLQSDNPEIERLRSLADGMPVPVALDFVPNGAHLLRYGYKQRRVYQQTAPAVNKMLYDWHREGLGIVVTENTARKIDGLHLSPPSWTPKKGKDSGRPITDMTADSWGTPLNSEASVAAAVKLWGPIEHPTITDIVRMILSFYEREKAADPTVQWEDVVLFKMDLRGAYTLLSFKPEEVPKLGIPLSGGLVLLVMCGMFGWNCTPFAFQVVTRAIVHELLRLLKGAALMFVDDLIGCTLRRYQLADLRTSEAVCNDLLGPKAVAPDKTFSFLRRMDGIGWALDLDLELVSIANKNFLRAIHGFFSLGYNGKFKIPEMEKMASWAMRYGLVFRCMRPLVSWLYNALAGRRNRNASHTLPEDAAVVIKLWRAVLCLGHLQESSLCRTLKSFNPMVPRYVVQFDASLQGIGIVWLELGPDGSERPLGGAAVSIASFGFGVDSQYQNVAEFMGIVVGVAGLAAGLASRGRPFAGEALLLRGDSVSALSWAYRERSVSFLARNALIVFVAVCSALNVWVDAAVHVAGEDNELRAS